MAPNAEKLAIGVQAWGIIETMELALIAVLFAVSIYTAIARPAWFWLAFIGGPALIDTVGLLGGVNGSAISAGPLTLRSFDPALLAIVVGVLYHCRRTGLAPLRKQPGGVLLLLLFGFVVVKTVISVLFFSDVILANHTASHAAGGLVAAVGEVRDNLYFLLPPLYAYAVPKSRDLKALSWPLFVTTSTLLVFWLTGVIKKGHIWTGNNDQFDRPIPASIAIDLTQLGFLLLFLPVPGLRPVLRRGFAVGAILAATLANHRSQWLAVVVGGGILLVTAVLGKPLFRTRTGPLVLSGAALALACSVTGMIFLSESQAQSPLAKDLSVRLYAFTDPGHDADSKWREALWQDRIAQVGGNWPWGRVIGNRPETLYGGVWVTAPDHSAYVASYELGGVLFCALLFFYFASLLLAALRVLLRARTPEQLWPAAVALSLTCAALAFGSAYDFPPVALGLIVALLCNTRATVPVRSLAMNGRKGTRDVLTQPSGPRGTPALG